MALNESIFYTLSNDVGVQTALGVSSAPFPIYPNRAPDAQAMPFVVVQQITGIFDATHNDNGQFLDSLYQFSCFATTYQQARDIRKAIAQAFITHDSTGLPGGEKYTLETERDLYEPSVDAHHCILEVRLFSDPTA